MPNDQAGHAKIGIDWKQGYGFQFWRCTHNAFRGDGRAGQLCVVIPEKDAVVAITADANAFQTEMNAIWDHLLPAFGDKALPGECAGAGEAEGDGGEAGGASGQVSSASEERSLHVSSLILTPVR